MHYRYKCKVQRQIQIRYLLGKMKLAMQYQKGANNISNLTFHNFSFWSQRMKTSRGADYFQCTIWFPWAKESAPFSPVLHNLTVFHFLKVCKGKTLNHFPPFWKLLRLRSALLHPAGQVGISLIAEGASINMRESGHLNIREWTSVNQRVTNI